MKVKTLLSNPKKWIKGKYRWGNRFCLLGALYECYGDNRTERIAARRRIEAAISEYAHKRAVKPSIIRYNDNSKTTFKDIRNVIKLANV